SCSFRGRRKYGTREQRVQVRSAGEMEVDVLPGGNGHAVVGGGMEAPVVQRGNDALLNTVAQPLQNLHSGDVALGIDGDLNHNIALQAGGELGIGNGRVGEDVGQCGTDLAAGTGALR